MDYLNPTAFAPQNSWQLNGGLGGLMAGQAWSDQQGLLQQAYQANQLEMMKNRLAYQQALAENPAKLAEYGQREAQAKSSTDILNSGEPTKAGIVGAQAKQSEAQTQMSNDQIQQVNNQGTLLNQAAEFYKNNKYNEMDDNSKKSWQTFQAQAKNLKIPQSVFPDNPSPEDFARIQGMSQAFVNNIPLQQKIKEIQTTGAEQRANTSLGQYYQTYRDVYNQNFEARTRNGAALEQARNDMAQGRELTEGQKNLLKSEMSNKILTGIFQSMGVQLQGLKDPDELISTVNKMVDKYFDNQFGKKTQTQTQKVTSSSLAGTTGKDGEVKSTEKGDYIYNSKGPKGAGWYKK